MTCAKIRLLVTKAASIKPFWVKGAVPLCNPKCPWIRKTETGVWDYCTFGRSALTFGRTAFRVPCRPAVAIMSKALQEKVK